MRYKIGDKIRVIRKAGIFPEGTIAEIIQITPEPNDTKYPYRATSENGPEGNLNEAEFVALCKYKNV